MDTPMSLLGCQPYIVLNLEFYKVKEYKYIVINDLVCNDDSNNMLKLWRRT